MKLLIPVVLALSVTGASAQASKQAYPSCDLPVQRSLAGQTGGTISDAGQAHLSMRANILQADIGNARTALRLTQPEADGLWKRVDAVRRAANAETRKQGFLSAGERASYDRALDAIAARICA